MGGEITGTRVQKGVEAGDPPGPQLVHIFASLEVLPANTLGFLTDVKMAER